MKTEDVELTYLLPEAMMQQMAPDTSHIHVTSDIQVQNLFEITKMHEVRLCVSNLRKMRTVSDEGDEDDEQDEDDEGNEDENDDGENDDGEEDADIPDISEPVDDGEDYSEYGNVKDKDGKEEDDMCFEDFKRTYGSEGGRSYGSRIYVNQSFANKDALVTELRLTAVRRKFSFGIYKSSKTLLVATCRVNGCGWKIRASVKHGTHFLGNQVCGNSYMFCGRQNRPAESKAWSGETEEIKMVILVGAIQDERTHAPEATHGLQVLGLQKNWSYASTM